jgi:hypothetical protein
VRSAGETLRAAENVYFYLLGLLWLALGEPLPAAFSMAVGLVLVLLRLWRAGRDRARIEELMRRLPHSFNRLDATHWSAETFGGEPSIVEMPEDFDIEAHGPGPLLERTVDPRLLELLGDALFDAYERPR